MREIAGQGRAAEPDGMAHRFGVPGEAEGGKGPFHEAHAHDPDLRQGQHIDQSKAHHLSHRRMGIGLENEMAVEQERHHHPQRIGQNDGDLIVHSQVEDDAGDEVDQRRQPANDQEKKEVATHAGSHPEGWSVGDEGRLTAWCDGKAGAAGRAPP